MKGAMRAGLILAIAVISVAAACGGEDAPSDPELALRIEVLAPIDEAEVITVVGPETEYMLRIVSGLPNACAEYKNILVNIVGDVNPLVLGKLGGGLFGDDFDLSEIAELIEEREEAEESESEEEEREEG